MAKYGMTWAVTVLTFGAAILAVLSFLLHLTGFSSPEWWIGPGEDKSPFISIGWHQACFDDCRQPYCNNGHYSIVYDGCFKWTFTPWLWEDNRLAEFKEWLLPEWFELNRTIVIIGLPLGGLSAAVLVLSVFFVNKETDTFGRSSKDVVAQVFLFCGAFLLLATAVICLVGILYFNSNVSRLDWVPMPEKNSFGYSFWMVVVSAVFYSLSFIMALMAGVFKTLRQGMQKDPRYSEEMMLGK